MEVVWVREFTPFIGTVVYAFASILAVYLTGTFVGSRIYRSWGSRQANESPLLWTLLALFSLFPLLAASPNFTPSASLRLVVGIAPFTALLGYLTPMLVDRWAGGDPAKAGKAYAVNVLGCILGPLLAGFLLLPWISERWSLVSAVAALADRWRLPHSSFRVGAGFHSPRDVFSAFAGGAGAVSEQQQL